MEIVLLGHMGRDEALADRLEGHKLHILGEWANPGLVKKAELSGGGFHVIDSIKNTRLIADFVQYTQPDMFLTNFDEALAAGAVDTIQKRIKRGLIRDLLLPCPDKSAARVEWDKFYLRGLIEIINPKYNPENFMVETIEEAQAAIAFFEAAGKEVALKPRNLTGGKGVKVQGKHFESYAEANDYAAKVLSSSDQTGLEVQEKLEGHEFTLQLFTDGKTIVRPPATYDYPYREDGDNGPGTGGMGAFSMAPGEQLPFITQADYDEAVTLMIKLLEVMKERGDDYKGVLYPTFFKTEDGLKIVEVNARGGDPELVNILDLMDDSTDFAGVLELIALGELRENSVKYRQLASAMIYLVAPDYGYETDAKYDFEFDATLAEEYGCKVRFAAAKRGREANLYTTTAASRIVGLSAVGKTPWFARRKIISAIDASFAKPLSLEFRQDIADKAYIEQLAA